MPYLSLNCNWQASFNSGKSKYSGGAPACPRPIPEWQKGIANFFPKSPGPRNEAKDDDDDDDDDDQPMAGGSKQIEVEVPDKENIDQK